MLFPDAVQRGALAERCSADPGSFHITCPLEDRDRPHSEPGTIPGCSAPLRIAREDGRKRPHGLRAALRPGKVQWRCAGGGVAKSALDLSYAIALPLQGEVKLRARWLCHFATALRGW